MRSIAAPATAAALGVASPCVDVCRMDAASGLCEGCLRTIEEIAEWSSAGEARRRAILEAVAMRRAARAA
ncbi:MAG TPA: DUF1289 domain-containing protein [Rhodocyclaceae bacterium]|nr:MAG: hypothetical protein AUK49_05340 [Betaproteobacteria bacterium CG2_30_68_42]PIV76442.1 MAG: DUF1289 domain-containing protein [Rhodocyclales bacterium CG17_big_fil_post_rev_8_21_14_2_50_68_7]PIX76242.1 MAG: DUF1289 domain-containing protein [Rhodocyclales bacterium CG_4_10_14_3_um_filter_68_10]PJA56183.1 MAG: DUF1289 domain-containing protein [Rhodocyclales bacterium CG_4_9_14_3_um_filter_68_10]HCX34064.1 DUF1289 domain-containing protein [Rhodocyclaceae bacterium]